MELDHGFERSRQVELGRSLVGGAPGRALLCSRCRPPPRSAAAAGRPPRGGAGPVQQLGGPDDADQRRAGVVQALTLSALDRDHVPTQVGDRTGQVGRMLFLAPVGRAQVRDLPQPRAHRPAGRAGSRDRWPRPGPGCRPSRAAAPPRQPPAAGRHSSATRAEAGDRSRLPRALRKASSSQPRAAPRSRSGAARPGGGEPTAAADRAPAGRPGRGGHAQSERAGGVPGGDRLAMGLTGPAPSRGAAARRPPTGEEDPGARGAVREPAGLVEQRPDRRAAPGTPAPRTRNAIARRAACGGRR